MAYNSPTETFCRIVGEYNISYSGTVSKTYRIANEKMTGSVFHFHQENILTKSVGNYLKSYEYFMTVGKRENNSSLKNQPSNTTFYTNTMPNLPGEQFIFTCDAGTDILICDRYTFAEPGEIITIDNLVGGTGVTAGDYTVSGVIGSWIILNNFDASSNITYGILRRKNLRNLVTTGTSKDNIWKLQFSAPGQKETLGVGQRDCIGDEYSTYNSLNFRNNIIRNGYNTESKKITYPYSNSYTVHGVNKNRHYILNATGNIQTKFDNGFIQNSIPYHNDQVQWLYSTLLRSSSYWPQWFVTGSAQTGSQYFYTESMIGTYLSDSFCSDIRSQYGFNSWVQIRSCQNSKYRLLKNNSFIFINTDLDSDNIFTITSSL